MPLSISEEIGKLKGARRAAFPRYIPPMLASLSESAFTRDGWIYEPKMDGMRCIAFVNGEEVKLLSRRGQNITSQYPDLVSRLPALCSTPCVLDGEIIALNESGKPSFQNLQKRMNLLKLSDITRADARIPVHYFVFDILYAGESLLTSCALSERKSALTMVLKTDERVKLLRYFDSDGKLAYEVSVENGFEGIVAKRLAGVYESGRRSPSWLKVKAQKSAEFLIAGYSAGQGSRASSFGSVLLGYYDDADNLLYAGSAGSGFDDKMLDEMLQKMDALKVSKCPFAIRPEDKKNATWLKPELVAEIKFMDWTEDKHLRNPVFLHLRYDIDPAQVRIVAAVAPEPAGTEAVEMESGTTESVETEAVETESVETEAVETEAGATESAATVSGATAAGTKSAESGTESGTTVACTESAESGRESGSTQSSDRASSTSDLQKAALSPQLAGWLRESKQVLAQLAGKEKNLKLIVESQTISLTNLDKVLFPAQADFPAISKRDFLKTIALLAPYLLAYLRYRPLTLIRAPSGLRARSFYQKHWNLDIPDFLDTIRTDKEDPAAKDQLLCNNFAALIYLAQHNIIEFHSWLARTSNAPASEIAAPHGSQDQLDTFIDPSPSATFTDPAGTFIDPALDYPDLMVFDIDVHKEGESDTQAPDRERFKKAVEAALLVKEMLLQIGLKPYVKTSGRSGLHIYVPLKRELKFDELRHFAEMMAKHAEKSNHALVSTSAVAARAAGKVFLDYQANTRGKSLAAPYTTRLTASASISTPVLWSELESEIDTVYPDLLNQHTIANRLSQIADIWAQLFASPEQLSRRFGKNG